MDGSYYRYTVPNANLVEGGVPSKDYGWIVGIVFALPVWILATYGFVEESRNFAHIDNDVMLGIVLAVAFTLTGVIISLFPTYWKMVKTYGGILKIVCFFVYPLLIEISFFTLPLGFNMIKAWRTGHASIGDVLPERLVVILPFVWLSVLLYQSVQLGVLLLVLRPWRRKAQAAAGSLGSPVEQ